MIPKIGLLICNSAASNTGTLTGMAAVELIKEDAEVGIFSLPALANEVPRQVALIEKVPDIIIVDGCQQGCAKRIAEKMGISCTVYLNIAEDLHIQKAGPFTTLQYSDTDLTIVKDAIKKMIDLRRGEGTGGKSYEC
jgi:uncharacterized metal-binding protein